MHLPKQFSATVGRSRARNPRGGEAPLQPQSRTHSSAAFLDVHRLGRKAVAFLRWLGVSSTCALLLVLALGLPQSRAASPDAEMANRYLRAAEDGDPTAQVYVAAFYSAGVGFRQSDREAFQWFLRAAERGHAQAQLIVAGLSAIGRGVPKDNIAAYRWAYSAERIGDPNIRASAIQLMEALATRMSADEREKAIRQASGTEVAKATPSTQPSQGGYSSLDEAIRRNPRDTVAYYNRGLARAREQEYELAVEDFGKVIQLDPTDAEAHNNRCWARAVLGRLDGALIDCDEALRLRPNYADAFDSRGLVNLKRGNLDRAISDFDAALRLKPGLASALYGRGKARLRQGAVDRGNADIKDAKTRDPKIEETFAGYGVN